MDVRRQILGKTVKIKVTPDLVRAIEALMAMLSTGSARKVEADSDEYMLSAWTEVQPNSGQVSVLLRIEQP